MNRKSRLLVSGAVAAAMALGTATLAAAQPSSSSAAAAATNRAHSTTTASSTGSADNGIPIELDANADLGAKGLAADSIYVTAHVQAGGHTFGVLVQTIAQVGSAGGIKAVSIVDETTGWYKFVQDPVAADGYTWSTTGLDIKMPGMTWSGNAQEMSIAATTPWGSLDLKLTAKGPVFYYAGTGEWEMANQPRQYEYALPALQTTGTLTAEDQTFQVTGESWLDRQWGSLTNSHWTWMNLSLSNGDKVAIWDVVGANQENCWATVLHPDGSYALAAVKPLADGVTKTWTSPDSGATYATGWRVDIPTQHAHLDVHITGNENQELRSTGMSRYEGLANARGIYQGEGVTGWTYVEQIGQG